MNSRHLVLCLAKITFSFAMFCPVSVFAADTVLSGVFDGSELKTPGLPGGCGNEAGLAYQAIGPVQVTASGIYNLLDAFNFIGTDVTALVYQGAFNPVSPLSNLLTPNGIDVADSVQLNTGVDYTLVVQLWCVPGEGAWAVTFSGPGGVNSANVVTVPSFTSGSFSGSDPILDSECGSSQYKQAGPVQVSHDGVYYFTDISIAHAVDMCLQIYTAPVNTANPAANRVALLDDFGAVQLENGQNYYFVAQPLEIATNGDYFYVFAPPAPFRITPGMAGSWYSPATDGQGFFLDVFDQINAVFLAWFTYDLERPDEAVLAQIGDPGHRWMTAFGNFQGGSADLSIEWTVGGIFDSGTPVPVRSEDGTISLEFDDCKTGTVTYDLGSKNASGVLQIKRIANDNVDLCEALYTGPGKPGPL